MSRARDMIDLLRTQRGVQAWDSCGYDGLAPRRSLLRLYAWLAQNKLDYGFPLRTRSKCVVRALQEGCTTRDPFIYSQSVLKEF